MKKECEHVAEAAAVVLAIRVRSPTFGPARRTCDQQIDLLPRAVTNLKSANNHKNLYFLFFYFFLSSGGWGKIKL